jgi:hypothetical protein
MRFRYADSSFAIFIDASASEALGMTMQMVGGEKSEAE